MTKIFLLLALSLVLNAKMVDGVAIVVKGEAITLYELRKEMMFSKVDADSASSILIRKKLEAAEIKERKITVNSSEIFDDIKMMASRNNLSVNEFYEAARNANGISSTELKEKIKEKLLSQKLYSAIAYKAMETPDDATIKEYYDLHKESFSHPEGFKVMIYQSKDQERLEEKINNPMLSSPDIMQTPQELPYAKISPELAHLLNKTPKSSFSPVFPDGKGGYMCCYVNEKKSMKQIPLKDVRDQISNIIVGDKREQVLSDYFARLRTNADIEFIRKP